MDASAFANVRNEEVDYGREASWTTFPERLEDLGVSWKIYQNELSLPMGWKDEEEDWLANFTDNPIEWFTQFHVRFSPGHRRYLEKKATALQEELAALEAEVVRGGPSAEHTEAIAAKREELEQAEQERERWSEENFNKLSPRERSIHERAFCTNIMDPDYHELTELTYKDGDVERKVKVPKSDVMHQFRQDVNTGKLPTVSWLVAPSNFSDHPGSAWFGAWYVSEALDILTKNPEVWKKTIFILTYDENDGYFDHVPPFVPPHPSKPNSGKVSQGIDTSVEYVLLDQDLKRKPARDARESSIGLGYRVPLVIASPWSRGGNVCSEVFDHTSPLQFMEVFLSHKTGKKLQEANITPWRRTVCGDLTSVFRPYKGEKLESPAPLKRDAVVEAIHRAKFQKLPTEQRPLTAEEQAQARAGSRAMLPKQEKGTRPSCALPYELLVNEQIASPGTFTLQLSAGNSVFGAKSAGAPFTVYAYTAPNTVQLRHYAVKAGDTLMDSWAHSDFAGGAYHLEVHGPNGFYRAFQGSSESRLAVGVGYQQAKKSLTGKVNVVLRNFSRSNSQTVEIHQSAYQKSVVKKTLAPGATATVVIETKDTQGWYDFEVKVAGSMAVTQHYAGRVETGQWSISDPQMA
ncbi:MAG: alkaline phosphatase family protein [Armatimonas sp.]